MNFVPCALALTLLSAPALADVTYVDFSSTAGLTLVGSAGQSGNSLELTSNGLNQAGAAWATTRQDVTAPFSSEITVQLTGSGEGMAFVIQRDAPDVLGAGGDSLGYGGIANAIVIEFDTAGSLIPQDPSDNHVSVQSAGAGAVSSGFGHSLGHTSTLVNLNDGAVHTIRMEYTPGALQVFVDGNVTTLQLDVDIDSVLNLADGTAWVGFTAASGGTAQRNQVLSWSFDEQSSVPTGNVAPSAPVISSPASTSTPYNPSDVYLEAGPFVDADNGAHVCSDWEIWTMDPPELVWRASCATAAVRLHAHLGQGEFMGSHTGQSVLAPLTSFHMRTRFRDDSTDPLTEWSPWSDKTFQTGAATSFYAFRTEDILAAPGPLWTYAARDLEPVLPVAAPGARIVLESWDHRELFSIESNDGVTNTVVHDQPLSEHVDVMVTIESGGAALELPRTNLAVVDYACQRTHVLIPAVSLAPNSSVSYWISSNGATWVSQPGQTEPDFSMMERGPAMHWSVAQPGYQVEIIAGGFAMAVNVELVPNPGDQPNDPLAYVVELYGAIKVVTNDGSVSTYADGLLNYTPSGQLPGSGEQGVSGVAIDPATGDVFASMLYRQGSSQYPKVVRFTSTDGGLTAATQTTILDMPGESQGQAHFISHIEFLPDSTLLVHMGDGFNASTARNMGSYRGKILRMNLDGSPVPSNPFYNGAPFNARDYIYVLGLRNPFGGRWRESDGFHYSVENGPGIDRFARIVPGRDYLWAGSNNDMLNFSIHAWVPATAPVNMAFIQPGTFGGSGFPESKWDHAFIAESGQTYGFGPQPRGKEITEFVLDSMGNKISGPTTLVEYIGPGRGTAAGLAAGPGGLFFTDLFRDSGNDPSAAGAHLLRIRWIGEDPGPCGVIGLSYCGPAELNSTGLPATIAASGSNLVADNDLTLEVEQLPMNSFGYCLASKTQGFVVNPGGSSGNLCLGGTIGRFVAQAQNSGATGSFSIPVDLANMPSPLNTVMVGESWNFQAWFRDFQIAVTSNFTDGVSVTFL